MAQTLFDAVAVATGRVSLSLHRHSTCAVRSLWMHVLLRLLHHN